MKQPGREISVRAHDKHGDMLRTIKVPTADPTGRPLVVIFIHGFNVDYKAALESYEKMQANLKRVGVSIDDAIWEFYWPGNGTELGHPALSYSFQIAKAQTSAEKLFGYLDKICARSPTTEFVFVAHSLGCRVLLELLKLFKARARQVKLATLMAAAVPNFMIHDRTLSLDEASGNGIRRKYVRAVTGLYSPADTILRFAFPLGQSLARGEGKFPEALGLHGEPFTFWSNGGYNTGLKHGDYWGSEYVARVIARELGVSVPRELNNRTTPSRKTGE